MKIKKRLTYFSLLAIGVLSSCATHPDKIKAQYVSPLQYDGYTCAQIAIEMRRLSVNVSELRGVQEKAYTQSNVATGVGLIIWPALFFIDGNSIQASEYARLKGEFNALEQAAVQKDCDVHIYSIKKLTLTGVK